jgi:D-glycero-alpha-D-manno-heptose-7-phosphate kinase
MLLYSNFSRDGTKIIEKQKKNKKIYSLGNYVGFVDKSLVMFNKKNITNLSDLFKKSWEEKKKIPFVTNRKINKIFDLALKSGATSGKLLGAGGGGFFLFLIPKNKQEFFKKKMKKFITINFKIINEEGSIVKNIN